MVFLLIKSTELDDEENSTNEGERAHDTVVPNQQRVVSEDNKRLLNSRRDSGGKQRNSLDERSHVTWSFRERILEGSNGSEDLGKTNQDVRSSLGPHVDVGWQWVVKLIQAAVGLVSTRRLAVDVHLYDGRPQHCRGTDHETDENLLDWREADAVLAESWVDDNVANRDHDDEGEWVEVVQDIGW